MTRIQQIYTDFCLKNMKWRRFIIINFFVVQIGVSVTIHNSII